MYVVNIKYFHDAGPQSFEVASGWDHTVSNIHMYICTKYIVHSTPYTHLGIINTVKEFEQHWIEKDYKRDGGCLPNHDSRSYPLIEG